MEKPSTRLLLGAFTGETVRAVPRLAKAEALSRVTADDRFTSADFDEGLRYAVKMGWVEEDGLFIRLTNLGLAELPTPTGTVK